MILSRMLFTISFFCLCAIGNSVAETGKVYTFGVVPQQAATKMARAWIPLLNYVYEQNGIRLKFKTAPDIPTFEQRMLAGDYDFAYMNPYHYTVFHTQPGYQAIMHARDKKIKGIIVVRKDAPYHKLSDLNTQAIAFPSPAAFAASILTRKEFSLREISIQPHYVSSHDSVYYSVAKGLYPAGGGIMRTFKAIDPAIREQLRILWTTPGYTPHAVAVHPRVDSHIAEDVTKILTAIDTASAQSKLLQAVNVKGWVKAMDSNWDDIRALDITLLKHLLSN